MTADHDVTAETKMTVHQRDLGEVGEALGSWLGPVLNSSGPVSVVDVHPPSGGGMSSVTVFFTAEWDGQRRDFVARLAPDSSSFPVFPNYDLKRQFDVMAAVAAADVVPIPPLVGFEPTGELLGSPFIVMGAVSGRVPIDNPPYIFTGWLLEATLEQRRGLQDVTAEIVAAVHSVPVDSLPQQLIDEAGPDPLRSHFDRERGYYAWTYADDGVRIPILERAFAWLEERWPTDQGDPVLSWGDARPGNILFDGFTPAAVLDWEMATISPRGLDIAWFPMVHAFFQDIADMFDQPGMPEFAKPEEYAATYSAASGHEITDLHWYLVYAALRHGIVMARIRRRMIHFGEQTVPDDPDDYVMHRALLERLMA
ncbi:phosphotransferase family protein [Antrihabitans sp. YC2-6]|uniref:phosphotransferase family protein n=1 Tax=Antrihabitans sp. YC2-6 TaxID=2799498 RepID=UPI0018F3545C|nr:phosphotransferase family protein [Antrihabitans sp. YC2-6]MBJ8343801.1 phosphotransferase family protein [Antrihabitans sp. YC2-6]